MKRFQKRIELFFLRIKADKIDRDYKKWKISGDEWVDRISTVNGKINHIVNYYNIY